MKMERWNRIGGNMLWKVTLVIRKLVLCTEIIFYQVEIIEMTERSESLLASLEWVYVGCPCMLWLSSTTSFSTCHDYIKKQGPTEKSKKFLPLITWLYSLRVSTQPSNMLRGSIWCSQSPSSILGYEYVLIWYIHHSNGRWLDEMK